MPQTNPPAAAAGKLTPEAAAEHTRRVNACLEKFGDMPTELIEQMPCTLPQPGQLWPEHEAHFVAAQVAPDGTAWALLHPTNVPALPNQPWGKYGQRIEGADSATDGMANTIAMAQAGSALAKAVLELPGHCYLPSRIEALLLFAALKEEIGSGAIWTSTQCSASYAWCQYFYGGGQNIYDKDCELRAVPVRRVQLGSFVPFASGAT